jgi:hypothetical protein
MLFRKVVSSQTELKWTQVELKVSCQSQSYLMTDGQSASLSWYQSTIWDPRPIFHFLPRKLYTDVCGFLVWGRPFWQEGRCVLYSYKCYWALPEQSLSGSSSAELETLPHLKLGSLSVASYNLQGYGGNILTHLHKGGNSKWTELTILTSWNSHKKHCSQGNHCIIACIVIFA